MEWSTPIPTPFNSFGGQAVTLVAGNLVRRGQPSPGRLRGGMMLARLSID